MFEALAGLAGAANTVWNSVYNYWRDQVSDNRAQRDFDYQKALQNQVFQREDTAVQRRMADLKAAGLNPNLAAGSAASAGAVVGRSNTPTSNYGGNAGNPVGTALDMAAHVMQLKAQREQNKILGNQERESAAKAEMAENQSLLNNIELFTLLGFKPFLSFNGHKFKAHWDNDEHDWIYNSSDNRAERYLNANNSRLIQELNWQNQNNKNAAFLLQKDADYYTADKVFGYIGDTARTIGNLTGGVGSIGSAYYNFRRRR